VGAAASSPCIADRPTIALHDRRLHPNPPTRAQCTRPSAARFGSPLVSRSRSLQYSHPALVATPVTHLVVLRAVLVAGEELEGGVAWTIGGRSGCITATPQVNAQFWGNSPATSQVTAGQQHARCLRPQPHQTHLPTAPAALPHVLPCDRCSLQHPSARTLHAKLAARRLVSGAVDGPNLDTAIELRCSLDPRRLERLAVPAPCHEHWSESMLVQTLTVTLTNPFLMMTANAQAAAKQV
jgi:hypothetical protein